MTPLQAEILDRFTAGHPLPFEGGPVYINNQDVRAVVQNEGSGVYVNNQDVREATQSKDAVILQELTDEQCREVIRRMDRRARIERLSRQGDRWSRIELNALTDNY